MTSRDFDYYTRRERQERLRAELATGAGARRVHLELAEHYASMLRNLVILSAAA